MKFAFLVRISGTINNQRCGSRLGKSTFNCGYASSSPEHDWGCICWGPHISNNKRSVSCMWWQTPD